MALSATELQLIEQRVTNDGPSTGVAWLMYLCLGLFGAHRFYLGRTATGLIQLFTLGGFVIWTLIDLFLLSGMIRARRDEIRQRLMVNMMATGGTE